MHPNILNTSFFAFARLIVKCNANVCITIFSAKRKYMFVCCFCHFFAHLYFVEPRICKMKCFSMAFIFYYIVIIIVKI